MSSRRERSPEKSAAMLTVRSRSMEASEPAGPGPNRQRFPMERHCGEAQVKGDVPFPLAATRIIRTMATRGDMSDLRTHGRERLDLPATAAGRAASHHTARGRAVHFRGWTPSC